MTKRNIVLSAVAVITLSTAIAVALPPQLRTQPASASQTTCPEPTAEGEYFQRGIDEQGNAICGFAFSNACPYSEAVSASDPMCYKTHPQEPEQAVLPTIAPAQAPQPASTCGVK